MSAETTFTERQKKAHEYLQKFHIQEILGDLLNTLTQAMSSTPVIFMIKYLSNLVSADQLKTNGITIEGQVPSQSLAIPYPKFSKLNANLFKTHLTPEVFYGIKNKRTAQNITMRELVNIALANEEHPIGVFACDKDTYSVFSDLFDPLLKDFNKGLIFSEKENKSIEDIKELNLEEEENLTGKENEMLEQITIKVKRNLSDFTFNSYNDDDTRKEIINKVNEAFKEINEEFSRVYPWTELTEDATGILKDLGMTKFNSQRPVNPRYKDWPLGRAIAIQKDKRYFVQINKEEHVEIVFNKSKEIDFIKDVSYVFKLLSKLQEKLKMAFDPKYGYLTSNPKYVGIAIRVKICVKIPEELAHIFKANIANWNMNYPFLAIQEIAKKGGLWKIKNTKTLGITEKELVKAFKNTIHSLLTGVVEAEDDKFDREYLETQGDEIDAIDYTQTEIDLTNARITSLFKESQLFKPRGKVGELTFEDFTKDDVSYPNLIKDNFGILENSYLIVRRNIEGLPLKSELQEHFNVQIIGFFMEFSKLLPRVFEGEVLTLSSPNYEETAKDIVGRYGLSGKEMSDKWPLGTAIYRAFNNRLIVIANLEDHLTIIYEFDSNIIANTLKEAGSLVHVLEKKVGSFSFNSELGYTTVDEAHAGSGLELAYCLKLHLEVANSIVMNAKDESLSLEKTEGKNTLRSKGLQFAYIRDLISLVGILLHKEKELLYQDTYKTKLQEIYSEELIKRIYDLCQKKSLCILDVFNSKLEFQCYDAKIYQDLQEPYMSYIKSQCPKKLEEINLQRIPEVELLHLPWTCPDAVTVKVEIGRNLDKYPFAPLLSVLDKNEINVIVQAVFQNLEIEGQLLEYRDVYNVSSSLRSVFEETFKIKQEDKVFMPNNKKFICWINQLDHVRLVGNVPVNKMNEMIKEFEEVLEEFEKEGNSFLYDENFGFISERLDLCGINTQFEVQISTEKERQSLIEDIFKENKDWNMNISEGRKENQIRILLITKGFSSINDSFVDINTLIEVLIHANGLNIENVSSASFKKPFEIEAKQSFIRSKTTIYGQTPNKSSVSQYSRAELLNSIDVKSNRSFVSPAKSIDFMDSIDLEHYFRRSLIDQERVSSSKKPQNIATTLSNQKISLVNFAETPERTSPMKEKKSPLKSDQRSKSISSFVAKEEEKDDVVDLKKESYKSPNKGIKSMIDVSEQKVKRFEFEGKTEPSKMNPGMGNIAKEFHSNPAKPSFNMSRSVADFSLVDLNQEKKSEERYNGLRISLDEDLLRKANSKK